MPILRGLRFKPGTMIGPFGIFEITSNKEDELMDRYVCTVCGYVYDPEEGDPDNGVERGTSFEDLPDDWTCPICGAGKDEFEKED